MARNQSTRSRIVVDTGSHRYQPAPRRPRANRSLELLLALGVIGAAALATFLALFLTSRPNDPMDSTFAAQQTIPQAPLAMPSASAPTPTATPLQNVPAQATPQPSAAAATPADDAAIQAQIEKAFSSDPALAQADISTIVEGGRVTIVGSVRSAEMKQRVERAVRAIKGIAGIDDQLVIVESSP
jgi:hypothetical protein